MNKPIIEFRYDGKSDRYTQANRPYMVDVFCSADDMGCQVAFYCDDEWLWSERGLLVNVTHWQPIPEPPTKD